jgi:hypothetical protein
MSFRFAGFFATPSVSSPAQLPKGAIWREIVTPFIGIGVYLPDLIDKRLTSEVVDAIANQLGLDKAERWVYLNYDCWGSQIDFIFGFGRRSGLPFGPWKKTV